MSSPASPRCPECGAPLSGPQARCWLCHGKPSDASAENPYAPPRPLAGENTAVQFSLASLFLLITLVAVCLGVFMIAPGLGILLVLVATPALIRTTVAVSYQKQAGAPLAPLDKVWVFFVSFFIMIAVGVAAFVAFQVVCWTGALLTQFNNPIPNVIVGVIVGLMAAIPLAIWILWLTRPSKESIKLNSLLRHEPPRDNLNG